MTPEDVSFLFEQIDVDGSGTIEEDEWRQFFEKACHRDDLKKRATLKDVYLREVFEVGIVRFKTTIQNNNSKQQLKECKKNKNVKNVRKFFIN